MGTRSGDVDPNLHEFLARRLDNDLAGVTAILNRESGPFSVSLDSAMICAPLVQAVSEATSAPGLAVEVFCYRLAKAILGLSAASRPY